MEKAWRFISVWAQILTVPRGTWTLSRCDDLLFEFRNTARYLEIFYPTFACLFIRGFLCGSLFFPCDLFSVLIARKKGMDRGSSPVSSIHLFSAWISISLLPSSPAEIHFLIDVFYFFILRSIVAYFARYFSRCREDRVTMIREVDDSELFGFSIRLSPLSSVIGHEFFCRFGCSTVLAY